MRVRAEDILKPGAVLFTGRIEDHPNYEEIKKYMEENKREQERVRRSMEWTQEDYDNLRKVITI